MAEVLASQDEMLRRRGTTDFVPHDVMTNAFQGHLKKVEAWLNAKSGMTLLRIQYGDLLRDPLASASAVQDFLGANLNVEAMSQQVDPSLYRNRTESVSKR
jgi:LPS sulfotransferase NodH